MQNPQCLLCLVSRDFRCEIGPNWLSKFFSFRFWKQGGSVKKKQLVGKWADQTPPRLLGGRSGSSTLFGTNVTWRSCCVCQFHIRRGKFRRGQDQKDCELPSPVQVKSLKPKYLNNLHLLRLQLQPSREACVERAGNPLQALLLLWRTTQIWPRSKQRLALLWRALEQKAKQLWDPAFPKSQLDSFSLPEQQDFSEVNNQLLSHIGFFSGRSPWPFKPSDGVFIKYWR